LDAEEMAAELYGLTFAGQCLFSAAAAAGAGQGTGRATVPVPTIQTASGPVRAPTAEAAAPAPSALRLANDPLFVLDANNALTSNPGVTEHDFSGGGVSVGDAFSPMSGPTAAAAYFPFPSSSATSI
jgi:hypothetical protein